MEQTSSTPLPQATTERRYGGFWIRFLATLIDGVIIGIIGSLVGGNQVTSYEQTADGMYSVSVNFFGWYTLIPIVYVLGFWIWKSATPGKMALKLKIIDEQGNNLTPVTAIIRYLGYLVSGIILGIGYLMIAFTKNKRGLHDMIAKTYVIRK